MDSIRIDKVKTVLKQSMRVSAVLIFISFARYSNVTKASNIRVVELLAVITLGMTMGAFVLSLVFLLKINKEQRVEGN